MKNLLKLNNFKILIDLLASFFLINFIYFIIKDFTTQISIYAPKVNILIILLFIFIFLITIIFINFRKIIYYIINSVVYFNNLFLFNKINLFKNKLNFISILLFFIFTLSTFYIQNIDIINKNFKTDNIVTIYTFWRLLFLISCFFAILAMGNIILKKIQIKKNNYETSFLKLFILSFANGIIFFSLVGLIFGFLGFLNSVVSYLIIASILLFSGNILNFNNFSINLTKDNKKIFNINNIILNLTYLTFIACIFIFIITHGLIPFNEDGDTWGHYMQYFESIKYTSSIHANEFWYHFHLSKGAGLFYFFNSVSDILSVQIISTLCIILIAIIIIDIVYELTKDQIWSITSSILFITSISIISPLNLFKHHPIFSTFIVIIFWSLLQLLKFKQNNKAINYLIIFSLFYVGFFQPVLSVFIFVFLILNLFYTYLFQKNKVKIIIYSNLFLIIGVLLSLIANYFYTGLIEVVKVDIFWNFANKEYFINKFGYAVIEYSHIANDGFLQKTSFLKWTRFIILEHSWEFIILLSTLIYTILILISILLKKIKNKNLNFFLIIFLLFSLVTLFFSFLLQQYSIVRMYIFINAFIYLPLCILIPIYFIQYQEIKIINISKNLIAIILYIPAFLSMFYIFLNYSNIVKSLYIQNNSLSSTYNTSIKNPQSKDLYNFTLEIRNDLPNEKIMLLSSVGGPGIFFPRPGLLLGPQRAFGMEWDLINKSQEVKQIREILEKKNINFFIIDLDKTLWGNLVISKMFENDHLIENLKIIKNYENMYLLTWKNKNEINKISQDFLTILDLKRSKIINSIFSNNFKKNYLENTNDINVFYNNLNVIKENCLKNSFNKNLIDMILNDIKKSNILINNIDDKIDNIRIITKKILLEKYEKFYFLNIDIKDSTPFEKIYLKNHEHNSCKLNY